MIKNNRHIHEKVFVKEQYTVLFKELRTISETDANEKKIALEYTSLLQWAEAKSRK